MGGPVRNRERHIMTNYSEAHLARLGSFLNDYSVEKSRSVLPGDHAFHFRLRKVVGQAAFGVAGLIVENKIHEPRLRAVGPRYSAKHKRESHNADQISARDLPRHSAQDGRQATQTNKRERSCVAEVRQVMEAQSEDVPEDLEQQIGQLKDEGVLRAEPSGFETFFIVEP